MLSKKELNFYIKADRIMNTGNDKIPFLKNLFYPNYTLKYLFLLRKCEYYQSHNPIIFNYYYYRFWRMGRKLNISINLGVFGDAFYVSTGAKIIKNITLSDGISVGANSVVCHSIEESDVLLAGTPAKIVKPSLKWYIRDGEKYQNRVARVEQLKKSFYNL